MKLVLLTRFKNVQIESVLVCFYRQIQDHNNFPIHQNLGWPREGTGTGPHYCPTYPPLYLVKVCHRRLSDLIVAASTFVCTFTFNVEHTVGSLKTKSGNFVLLNETGAIDTIQKCPDRKCLGLFLSPNPRPQQFSHSPKSGLAKRRNRHRSPLLPYVSSPVLGEGVS